MADPAVLVEDVSKRFRLYKERNNSLKAALLRGKRVDAVDFWALKGVSFEVPHGQTFGLVGENGSGKSTMLKCLTRILRPDSGRIEVNGKVSALLELGAGFHPELTGRENVFLNGAILGLSQRELTRRFDDIVAFAGIERFIDEPVKNYSSGMYVRLGFSVAINVDPDVLLVDEVLAVGDENFQRKCNEKFAELKAEGKTIVLVSHAMQSVQQLCDQVAWFEHGVVQEVGSPRDVIEKYTGTAHTDRVADGELGSRWGSGEGRIAAVEVLGADGRPDGLVSGERATIRMHYDLPAPLRQPVFSWFLETLSGQAVAGSNTMDAGVGIGVLDGRGHIDAEIDPLRLLPGTYDLTVVLSDPTRLHEFDHRHHVLRFEVERGPIADQWGIVSLAPTWLVHEDDRAGA